VSGFSWADYQLLPEDLLSSSECGQASAQNFCGVSGFNPDRDCNNPSNPTNVGVTACQEMKFYLVTYTVLSDFGNPNNEGAYVTCNNGINDFANCTQGGGTYFSVTSDYAAATPNKNVQAVPKGGGSFSGGPYYCPLTRCDVTTDDVWFYINDQSTGASVNIKLQNGQSTSFPITDIYPEFSFDPSAQYIFRVNQVGSNLCVFVNTDTGPMIAGCKPYVPPPTPSPAPSNSSCFSTTACAGNASVNSQAFWSVSGKIVECVQDVIDAVFIGSNPACASFSFLGGLQQGLRQAVMVALLLYVVLFGFNIVTSGGEIKKSDLFVFILKFALVLYFSVGIVDPNGQLQSGLSNYVYPGGLAAMSSFANFIMTAANSDGLCFYNPTSYAPGYSYLAIWDSLDCRVAYYLGLYLVNTSGSTSSVIYGVLGVIIPALLSLEIIFFILLIVYGVFILSFAVYFVHFYVIALIMFAITVYLGVIMVPLALFSYTKGFFDAWLKMIISYVIQPVIVLAFMAFVLMIFDIIVFGNCQFTQNSGPYPSWSTNWTPCTDGSSPRCCNPSQQNPNQDPNLPQLQCTTITTCQKTLGYILLSQLETSVTSFSAIFINLAIVNENIVDNISTIIGALLEVILFIYLLSLFGEDLGNFAAKLTSGPNIGEFAKSPSEVFKSIMKNLLDSSKGDPPKPVPKSEGDDTKVSGKKRDGIDVMKSK